MFGYFETIVKRFKNSNELHTKYKIELSKYRKNSMEKTKFIDIIFKYFNANEIKNIEFNFRETNSLNELLIIDITKRSVEKWS